MDYLELRSWRDICEYLTGRWYKFARVEDIARNCPNAIASLYRGEGRLKRQELWDRWTIQFLSWGDHPIFNFKHSKYLRQSYGHDRGWTLVSAWEAKIDFLEQLYVLERNESTLSKSWVAPVRQRIEQRRLAEERRQEYKQVLKGDLKSLQLYRLENNLCPHCQEPQVQMMLDCPSCQRSYEVYF